MVVVVVVVVMVVVVVVVCDVGSGDDDADDKDENLSRICNRHVHAAHTAASPQIRSCPRCRLSSERTHDI